jgi:putative addiction module component (TIGR02574 family)
MSTDLKELARELQALPVASRTFLLDQLWQSFATLPDTEVEHAWLEESERRWQEIQTGRSQTIPADQVMHDARAALKKCG